MEAVRPRRDVPTLEHSACPDPGATVGLTLANGPPAGNTAMLRIGTGGGGELPLHPGCNLQIGALFPFFVPFPIGGGAAPGTGTATLFLPIPRPPPRPRPRSRWWSATRRAPAAWSPPPRWS